MRFSIRMAWREIRRSSRKFLFFLLCIAVGVAGLVSVKGFNANMQSALLREARTLMAADMTVSLSQPPSAELASYLAELRSREIAVLHTTETASMAVHPLSQETALVEVKAVESGYPFYGSLEVEPAAPLTNATALVGGELLDRLGLKVGDTFSLGQASFVIAGVIIQEPDRVSAGFSFGPRVMITQAGLSKADLIRVGSRARQIYLLKLAYEEQVVAVRSELTAQFAKERPRIADFREAQPQVRRILDNMTAFLSLVSLIALLVGGLGVANATRVFIHQKLDSIAIMKCLGATNRKVVSIYLTQMILLSLTGSLIGVLAGYGIQLLLPGLVGNWLDLNLPITLDAAVALQGITVGLVASVLFTLLPITAIADIKPARIFRREMAESQAAPSGRKRLQTAGLVAAIGLALSLIATWVSGSYRWGFAFMGGLAGASLLLNLATLAVIRLLRRVKVPRNWLSARQGLANLYRPGSQAISVVLALGIGVTVVLAVYLLQRGLTREVQLTSPAGAPNIFFMGLQPAEAGPFIQYLRAAPGVQNAPEPTPLVRGRLITVNGLTQDQLKLTHEEERWFNFQFSLTYSSILPPGNELFKGSWWTETDWEKGPIVSVEEHAAELLGLKIGAKIAMDLEGGIPIEATVFNIRRATDYRAGNAFNFIFAPGAMAGVPVSYLAQARLHADASGPIQKEVVARFPGVTVIGLHAILQTVGKIIDQIGLVIRFVSGFSVATGLIILASSIAATKFHRTRDAVLYKTLGATRQRVLRIFAVEYFTLGLIAGLISTLLASITAWILLTQVMELVYHFEWVPLALGIGSTLALTVLVGLISTLDVLAAKPLQILRDE